MNGCDARLVGVLEAVRALVCNAKGRDVPVYVNDAYRCKLWNERVPNAVSNSQHVLGLAADISVAGMSAQELLSFVIQVPEIRGIGRADVQRYVHVDVREEPARWCYSPSGRVIPWIDLRSPQDPVAA